MISRPRARSRLVMQPSRFGTTTGIGVAVALVIALLTPIQANAASRTSFPDAPQSAPVEGYAADQVDELTDPSADETKVQDLPEPQAHTVELPADGEPVAIGDTGITVAVGRADDESPKSDSAVEAKILDDPARQALGGVPFAIELTPTSDTLESFKVSVPNDLLDGVSGADLSSRIRWEIVDTKSDTETAVKPAAASEEESGAIHAAAASYEKPVPASRPNALATHASTASEATPAVASTDGSTTTFDVPASASSSVLVASSSTTSSNGSGTYSATSLKPASSWNVSAQTGAFAWSYPIPVPVAPAGKAPDLALSYNSQLVDGATASTNNQPSAIGEGWTLGGAGFIERRYVSCSQEESPGAAVAGSGDLCWATDNATISFGDRSGPLVKDSASGQWKLQGDDNSRIEKLVGTGQGCAPNGTNNTECWRLTTTDGTQYYFGLNRLPGWVSGNRTTNSTWTAPVFGNDDGDPCHASTFAASSCQQGWRWNLDYVVDVHGNAQAFYYSSETNKYRLNNTTPTSYIRGGQLTQIDYGLKASTVYAANAATSRVVFDYDDNGRCNPANQGACSPMSLGGDATTPGTPAAYPDVPFDLNCTSGACTGQRSPSFWTTARLSTISTQTRTAGNYQTVDEFRLSHSFPDPGDGQSAALWLDSLQRTAMPGSKQIVEEPTRFQKTSMQNRVWVVDGLAPLTKFRVSSISLPTGARVSVNYSAKECTAAMAPGILDAPWSNTKRCFPMWWTPNTTTSAGAQQDLFHKYIVTSMIEDPYTGGGGSRATRTNYVYTGTPGWRYVDDPLVPSDRRTWSEYAGYDRVEVRVGDPANPSQQETKQYLFYRGLNGDRAGASGGTKSVKVTGTSIPDDRWFAGSVRSVKTLDGAGGATISETVTTPWASAVTADDGVRESRVVGIGRSDVIEPLSSGDTRTVSTIYTMDNRGFVTQASSEAGAGQTATCTTTSYAADNTSAWIIGLPSVVTEYSVPCGQLASAKVPQQVLSHKKIAYDGGQVGAAPAKGLVSETWEASSYSGSTLASATLSRSNAYQYDAMGRVTKSTDAASRSASTAYSPSATAGAGAGPLTKTTVTNPMGWTTVTTVDPYRGLPITVTDENGKTATTEYDALGRLTKVWRADHPKADNPTSPTTAYEYNVSTSSPSSVKTTSLLAAGTVTTFDLVDGLGRIVQRQAPVPGGGAVISDTEYDNAGRTSATNDRYWAPSVTPGSSHFVPSAVNQISTRTETIFDGVGRPTAQLLRSFGNEIRRTSTVYRGADRVDTVPPAGGVPTSTFSDAWGNTSRKVQWHGAIDGTGVGSTSLTYEYNARNQMTRMLDDVGNEWTWSFSERGRQTATTDPDAGTTSFTYDELGNVLTSTDARGTTLAYTYDTLNRKTTERSGSPTGTVLASWTYDTLAKGQLTSSSRFASGLEYKTAVSGYDDGYRATGATLSIPTGAPAFGGTTYTTSTYYNPDGSVAANVVPAIGGLPAEELYPSYDTLGRQNGLTGATTYVSGVSYLASGEVGQIIRPGTVWSALTMGYDPGTRQLTSLDETTRRNGTDFTQEALREYTRNAAGIITRASTTADNQSADIQCFRYNALQALKDAWTPASGDCSTGASAARGGPAPYRAAFNVDPDTGNRTKATTWSGSTATSSTYSYPAAGAPRPHAVTQVSTVVGTADPTVTSYAHDASGAMTTRGAQTLTFDQSGRVSTVKTGSTTERSLYTADGSLLMRWGGSDGASLFMGDTILRNKSGAVSGVRSYSVAGMTIAERVSGSGGGLWWLSPDPVGTVSMQINAASGAVTRRWMDPFGNPRGTAATWSSNLGYLNAPASATGLTQLGARAYDPKLGKFVSVDPVLDVGEPRHTNAYTYAYHSPVSFSDPTGLLAMKVDWGPRQGPKSSGGGTGSAPPAAGNGEASAPSSPTPSQPVQWWNPTTWDQDTWTTIGITVLAVVATVAIGACVVATAGICAAVGVGIGVVASATVGAAAATATYQLTSGPKTAEGGLTASLIGAAGGALGGAVGLLAKPATGAVAESLASAVDPIESSVPLFVKGQQATSAAAEEGAQSALETLAPIKPGTQGGPTAGQAFSKPVKAAAHAENPEGICVYCHMRGGPNQVDHAIPKSLGGDATLENAQIACAHCNASKGARQFPVNPPLGYSGPWPPPWWEN